MQGLELKKTTKTWSENISDLDRVVYYHLQRNIKTVKGEETKKKLMKNLCLENICA